jgi:hypothetical protein
MIFDVEAIVLEFDLAAVKDDGSSGYCRLVMGRCMDVAGISLMFHLHCWVGSKIECMLHCGIYLHVPSW